MEIIDEGIANPTSWSQGKKFYNQRIVMRDQLVKNSGGRYFENCVIEALENVSFENIHSVVFKDCVGADGVPHHLCNVSIVKSHKGFDMRGTKGLRGKGLESAFANDLTSSGKNGDGFIFEAGSDENEFEDVYVHHNTDAGIDCKGNRNVFRNVRSERNKHGFKLWGQDIEVHGAEVKENSGNAFLVIAGRTIARDVRMSKAGLIAEYDAMIATEKDPAIKAALIEKLASIAGARLVQMGLKDYASLKKTFDIAGWSDVESWYTEDVNSTLIQAVTIGAPSAEPPTMEDWKAMYQELLKKYQELGVALAAAVKQSELDAQKIVALEAEVSACKTKLDQIRGIVNA